MKTPVPAALLVLALLPPAFAAGNALADAPSALVRRQADSPVQWHSWGDAAFERAKKEDKPVFVTVGMFTSELTRAMARQSFANADAAALLNENFVSVYVDAKERPDVAALCQHYLQNVKQLSGPPMNLWLTPELKPFEGANYLPPTEEWGKEGFITANKRVAAAWKADPAAQRRKADEALATLKDAQPAAATAAPTAEETSRLLTEAATLWRDRFDAAHGGFGETPKQIEPELLRWLLRTEATREMALKTMQALINSAVRDPLDGGFFRYAVDAEWKQPYFQKLLSDQPRMALALLDASAATGDARYAAAAQGALTYALERLRLPNGDFAGAEDATAEAATMAYTWSADELRDLLGDAPAEEFMRLHGATAAGNIPEDAFPGVATKGRNILYRAVPLPASGPEPATLAAADKLRQGRHRRAAAERDDGSPSGSHGLMLTALARAGAELKDAGLARAAKDEAAFIRDHLRAKDGSLLRLAGRTVSAAPSDYALVIEGLRTFAHTTSDDAAEKTALDLLRIANERFWDAATHRYFVVSADTPGAWARVYSPVSSAGDPPSAEPAMLLALTAAKLDDAAARELAGQLAGTIAKDIKDSAEAPRGDLLLALARTQ
ncbi:thioredoxin domain-containing protein [Opitutus terrae]|uniref:Spermatogenesis-associated protein 20-like TRX domain-containing protein n=1 Tax=Opitutus terrae (strain DSM 11246 / JCM 15787 / PB90-1) TaxID=452637 RepID=B1ZQJ5_OPITP|nr:DUF255 domain-containing protein [Opitutus terrae]ACB75604.1 protein of unknown function DUF255 [Opitutus terrae PB90-1]